MVYYSLDRFDFAERAFLEAIDSIETLRHQVAGDVQEYQRYFETRISPYHGMVRLLIRKNNIAQALAYTERARSRVLLDVLEGARTNPAGVITNQESKGEQNHDRAVPLFNSRMIDAVRPAELLRLPTEARLGHDTPGTHSDSGHPEMWMHQSQSPVLTLEDAAASLNEQTAWLEFVVMEERTYLFTLTRRLTSKEKLMLRVYPIRISRNELAYEVAEFRKQLTQRRWDFEERSNHLYESLIKPAEQQLLGATTLCISPDGPLWDLPFPALQKKKDRYLLDDYALYFAPSLTVLRDMEHSRRRTKEETDSTISLLAFGSPSVCSRMSKPHLSIHKCPTPLPDAAAEVYKLKRLYSRSDSYTGTAATEERAKAEMGKFAVLHFATHALLDNGDPLHSHLLLSRGDTNTEDGLLEARELMGMDLKADMAVLSACETARGQFRAGEGVIGLSWAFFVAGCPTAVVSQWKVNSHSTARLMVDFHRKLPAQNSKAVALQRAALKLRRNSLYEHPFFWAPFMVIGKNSFLSKPI